MPFACLLVFLIAASPAVPGQAQATHQRSPRAALIEDIRTRAQQDARVGREPAGPQDLAVLFGEETTTAGLKLSEAISVYDDAYAAAKPPRRRWVSVLGWIAAGILLFFRDWIKEMLGPPLRITGEWLYRRIAGHRLFRRKALQHYRRALVQKYRQLKVPFRPDRPLDVSEVYVPLKVKGADATDQVDAVQRIAANKRLMVVGAPGSGKSMLLRHLALSYARGLPQGMTGQPVPVLLELNRLNEQDGSIEDHLVKVLDLNDFPNAGTFVRLGLEKGTLLLLFDGLDEVNTAKRTRIVQEVKDLLDRHEQCRAVISCRKAVYRDEFAGSTDETLEIVEFSDQEIQRFLASWQSSMPPGKSIEQLVLTLRERPRIMALARNPLLLTIIAFLYTDLEFVLPHSRADFYDKAVDLLLGLWKVETSRFPASSKRLALEHLALFNQDRSATPDQDRRSIDLKTVLAEIVKILPSLNIDTENATPFLGEIVERSGLLLAIGGGTRYQFAHLSLQEFFAATALRDDSAGLLDRFQKDRDAWRETVKLWCGLNHDSTSMIRAIRETDSITAFECLADAQRIDPALADEIVGSFRDRLGEPGDAGDAILQAFAAVASGPSQRGKGVFEFLSNTLRSEDSTRAGAAARGLSLTNHPAAARVLGKHYGTLSSAVRPALVRLGDLAVPTLKALASKAGPTGSIAVEDLASIKTPSAAIALANLLWLPDKRICRAAAWRLATLTPQSNVEEELRETRLTADQKPSVWKSRLLEPFGEPPDSPLSVILGRAAALIDEDSRDLSSLVEVERADLRILVPIILESPERNEISTAAGRFVEKRVKEQIAQPEEKGLHNPLEVRRLYLETAKLHLNLPALSRLLDALEVGKRFQLLYALLGEPKPTVEHWRYARQPLNFNIGKCWQFWLALALAALYTLGSLSETAARLIEAPAWLTWSNGALLLAAISLSITWLLIAIAWNEIKEGGLFFILNPISKQFRNEFVELFARKDWFAALGTLATFLPFMPINIFLTTLLMSRQLSATMIFGVWAISVTLLSVLHHDVRRKEVRAKNPLHSLLLREEESPKAETFLGNLLHLARTPSSRDSGEVESRGTN